MRAPRFIHQHRFDLAADALLISSGLFSLVASVGLTLMWVTGGFQPGSAADAALSDTPLAVLVSLLMLGAGTLLGPLLAWRLHGHALHWRHLIALVGGPAVLAVVSSLVPLLATVFHWLLRPLTDNEFVGPLAVGVLFAIPYCMLLLHAWRDAMAPAGDPPALERMRMLSILGLLLLVLVVAGALALGLSGEIGEAFAFAMIMGFSGAAIVLVAAAIDGLGARIQR